VTLRGLKENHNHDLKDIFKGAARRASSAAGPLHDFYEALRAKGRRPTMGGLPWARKMAAITWIVCEPLDLQIVETWRGATKSRAWGRGRR
jgi:hypothetical protein